METKRFLSLTKLCIMTERLFRQQMTAFYRKFIFNVNTIQHLKKKCFRNDREQLKRTLK